MVQLSISRNLKVLYPEWLFISGNNIFFADAVEFYQRCYRCCQVCKMDYLKSHSFFAPLDFQVERIVKWSKLKAPCKELPVNHFPGGNALAGTDILLHKNVKIEQKWAPYPLPPLPILVNKHHSHNLYPPSSLPVIVRGQHVWSNAPRKNKI